MTFFIAEICSNHLNDFNHCKKIIDEAKKIGCDAVKFQLFKSDKLFAPEILNKSKSHNNVKNLELSLKLIPKLKNYSKKKGLLFGCTPFDLEAVDFLSRFVDFFKIGSYELLRLDIFERCLKYKKKIIFSTGMASQNEIEKVLHLFKKKKFLNFAVLRCVSNYPATIDKINLSSIKSLRSLVQKKFKKDIKIGWSDHTRNKGVILKSIFSFNSEIIEFHLDLDGNGPEYQAGHCWLPDEIKDVIKYAKESTKYDGVGVLAFQKSEINERKWRSDPKDGLRPMMKERKKFR